MEVEEEEEPIVQERPRRTFFLPAPISPFEDSALGQEAAAMNVRRGSEKVVV